MDTINNIEIKGETFSLEDADARKSNQELSQDLTAQKSAFGIEETLLSEQTVDFADLYGVYTGMSAGGVLVPGAKYRVLWDGEEYFCTAKDAALLSGNGMTFTGGYLGNAAVLPLTGMPETGEPFYYTDATGELMTADTAQSHTVSVQKIKTLDSKWLSESPHDAIVEYHKKNAVNPNNLFADPLMEGTGAWWTQDDWTPNDHIIATDTLANGMRMPSAVDLLQDFRDLSVFKNGRYVIRYKRIGGSHDCKIGIQAIGIGEAKIVYELGECTEAEFDFDIEEIKKAVPTVYHLRIRIGYKWGGECIVTEPYLGLSEGGYTGFWNVANGDAVRRKEYTDLKTVVDAQTASENPLYGKIIAFNGDSICEARETNGGGYATIIGARNNMIVQNIGVSGGMVLYTEGKHCISRTVVNMREDADYIILEGGVNDLYDNRPIGTLSNGYNATLDDTTFYGAFENMLKQALIRFPGKKIGYIAVHKMGNYFSAENTENSAYHAAIECCAKWGIPVCDLNVSCPPFSKLSTNDATKFICDAYTENGDGWHPNEEGYTKYYVPKIEAWLKTL